MLVWIDYAAMLLVFRQFSRIFSMHISGLSLASWLLTSCLDALYVCVCFLDDYMENKKSLLIGGLKNSLHEPNNKVKKMLAQTIIAMAHHEYLEQEGGHLLVEFIVRQCAMDDAEPVVSPPLLLWFDHPSLPVHGLENSGS